MQLATPLHKSTAMTHCSLSLQDIVVNPMLGVCLHVPLQGAVHFCTTPLHLTSPLKPSRQVPSLQQIKFSEKASRAVMVSLPQMHELCKYATVMQSQ